MKNQTLRIIAGKWRGRKIIFPANIPHLRPTSDRIRESLFNWLQSSIHNTTCLDLFAGSGALGFEALSRGAEHCTFIEQSPQALTSLKKSQNLFDIDNCQFIQTDAFKFLKRNKKPYDLIFLDPPFDKNLLPEVLTHIIRHKTLHLDSQVYIEVEKSFDLEALKDNWEILKSKKSGDVQYGLIKLKLS